MTYSWCSRPVGSCWNTEAPYPSPSESPPLCSGSESRLGDQRREVKQCRNRRSKKHAFFHYSYVNNNNPKSGYPFAYRYSDWLNCFIKLNLHPIVFVQCAVSSSSHNNCLSMSLNTVFKVCLSICHCTIGESSRHTGQRTAQLFTFVSLRWPLNLLWGKRKHWFAEREMCCGLWMAPKKDTTVSLFRLSNKREEMTVYCSRHLLYVTGGGLTALPRRCRSNPDSEWGRERKEKNRESLREFFLKFKAWLALEHCQSHRLDMTAKQVSAADSRQRTLPRHNGLRGWPPRPQPRQSIYFKMTRDATSVRL